MQVQELAYDHVRWVFHGPLASGRTHLLAVLAIEYAMHTPNVVCAPIDHALPHYNGNRVLNTAAYLIKEYDMADKFVIDLTNGTLKYVG